MTDDALSTGARNLLQACAGLQGGHRLLIVHEDPSLGWHDLAAPTMVARLARQLQAQVTMWPVGAPGHGFDPALSAACQTHDITLFFARCGDQERFAAPRPGQVRVVCYARNAGMLGSAFGTVPHQAMRELKQIVDGLLQGAHTVRLTCPLGTDLAGPAPDAGDPLSADVAIRRFPLGVPSPVDAAGYSGRVALAHYLTPTGSRVYEPASLAIEGVVFARIDAGRVTALEGAPAQVAAIRRHTGHLAARFGLDADVVHSWHAGLHGGLDVPFAAADDPDRWSNTAFMHPRFLHFHTCANGAPGEVCWMVRDPTIRVDDRPLWQRGRLVTEDFQALRAWRARWPAAAAVVLTPAGRTGLG